MQFKQLEKANFVSTATQQNGSKTSGLGPWNPMVIFLLLLSIGFSIWMSSDFWEQFENDPELDQELVAAAKGEAEAIADRHEKWIQYALIATHTMKRPCLRCPDGVTMVTVKAGEVYKYGITTQKKKRYTKKMYEKLELTMIVQNRGDYTFCKRAEIRRILAYQFLPESWKLEVRLFRPPGNASKN
ncbi:MAG: hypothetical protein AAF798_18135 [Bacteroidota bacterium]